MNLTMEARPRASRTRVRMLCEGALLVAAAQILSYVKFLELPNGGALTPAMFPVLLFAVRWGWKDGLLGGLVLGILQFMFDGGFALGWQSILGDYLLAFTALGLAGVFRGRRWGIFAGTVLGCAGRFLVHYVVGATIWAEYMPEEFLSMTMTSPWLYSLLYNGVYMLPNMVLALVIGALLYRPMGRYLTGADIE
ncbi:energy-coupled thiamine transporter ThiT [Pseudoflavonifractor gallinarum]|nr:energy-coupled thiamine transporter ThiT [Pseudoflavonifractor hominis]